MRFRILRVEELPLGTRILRPGAEGADVRELQELLAKNGFYFGKSDGQYGLLTEEAVRLMELTFRLTVDGIAGRQVIAALKNPSRQTGRVIYTIKAGDNLKNISRKFNVNSSAWERIPGQGNPKSRLYPGMRLLLHEKALFLWDEPATQAAAHSKDSNLSKRDRHLRNNIQFTGLIRPGWLIEPNGDLTCLEGEPGSERDSYQIIEAPPEVWKALFTSKALRAKLGNRLRKLYPMRFGFDLRAAPLNTIINWPKFIKSLYNDMNRRAIKFLILPLLPPPGHGREKHPYTHESSIYWIYLPLLSEFAELLVFEQLIDTQNPLSYENSAAGLPQTLLQLGNLQLNHKSLLLITPDCWDWNLELASGQAFLYPKAKMIRAVNLHTTTYSTASKLTTIHYTSRRQAHCLIYRDIQGLEELFTLINKANLLGLTLRNFEVLGKSGVEVILKNCTVLPAAKLIKQ
jgi:peptidoglycan hydrolase-like protein with peptidoglycan-binding domain